MPPTLPAGGNNAGVTTLSAGVGGATSTLLVTNTVTATGTALPPTAVTQHLGYGYDDAGRRTSLTDPDGQGESWGYDGAGRPLSTTLLSGTTTLFSQTATLDAAGQRVGLDESGGHTAYGYDAAGRLASALYPDGTSEQDQYDAAGNRLLVTSTDPLSGTAVTANGYDAADELLTSTTGLSATTYSYDGNGNQTGSVGPSGSTTNAFNDLNQLTQVSGPSTDASYVYDGQGDRLRLVEPGAPQGPDQTLAQDLATGGLTALASNGTQDYAYLDPGNGQAPLAGTTAGTGQSAYLGTDLLGSVRVATDGSNTVIGAGRYDAWGNARPSTPGIVGLVQLAGLQAATPFGYAGQQYDAGSQTYAMRAREYSPQQGQFLSGDPHPSDPQVPVTLDPYAYAGQMPTEVTDPSGQWFVPPSLVYPGCPSQSVDPNTCTGNIEQAAEDSLVSTLLNRQQVYVGVPHQGLSGPPVRAPFRSALPGYVAFNVPVARVHHCTYPAGTRFIADVWDPVTHQYWDIEKWQPGAVSGGTSAGIRQVVKAIQTVGLLWPKQDQLGPGTGPATTQCTSGGSNCVQSPSVAYYSACGDGVNYLDCYEADLSHLVEAPDAAARPGDSTSLDAYVGGSNVDTGQQSGSGTHREGIGTHHYYCLYYVGCGGG